MQKTTQLKLLKHLEYLKLFGYNYLEDLDIDFSTKENIALPDNLFSLQNFVNSCSLCKYSKTRKNVVFGKGNSKSDIMFIGTFPSKIDDEEKYPFSGKMGELLTKMVENVIGVSISEVYITNILKCIPTNTLDISSNEISICTNYLNKQIEIVNPKIIVFLGEDSYNFFFHKEKDKEKNLRDKVIPYKGKNIVVTHHPNFLLRNPSLKKESYYDMLKIKSLLEK